MKDEHKAKRKLIKVGAVNFIIAFVVGSYL